MSTQLRTIRQVVLALLFVALAALALMAEPGAQSASEAKGAHPVSDQRHVGVIERVEADTSSTLDCG